MRLPPVRAVPLAQAGAEMKRPPAAGDAAAPASAPVAFVEVRGRVVDPQGRPVSGATVREAWLGLEDPPFPDATSGADGRFVARISRSARSLSALIDGRDAMPWIAATAPGFGPGWAASPSVPTPRAR